MNSADEIVQVQRLRISQIGDMHLGFERQFEEFNQRVPYKYNWQTIDRIFSPDLYSLLQGINSAIDGMLRILGELFELDEQKYAGGYFKSLNPREMLYLQEIAPVQNFEILMPFRELRKEDVPSWWTGYNQTKHKLPEGMSRATYANTMNALGALVILLHISYPALVTKEQRKMLDSRNWTTYASVFKHDYERLRFSKATTSHIDEARREYLHSQEQIYRSRCFYYLAKYHGG